MKIKDKKRSSPAAVSLATDYLSAAVRSPGGLLLYKKHKAKIGTGLFMGYCLFTIFTFRFFVEFIKENQVAFEDGMTLIMGQWLSIPFIIIGIAYMWRGLRSTK